eukprot:TRINITY_DN20962_c0_g1_i1.p1 TRINITY_DN20962_c0_g1~~TRINITY_DN20962_c0_g1_i1.p1  ORF type:complete len:772 (+),score=41.66 TRINITY_DN20962_c0_g1_i1:295-2316(+)
MNVVIEYANAGDLNDFLKTRKKAEQPLSEHEIRDTLYQTLLGIQHIHSKRILHRDLKPCNIFLTKKQQVKIGDFGISKLLEESNALAKTAGLGTPFYMAPELYCDGEYDKKCDVWSLGCIAYEMATFEPPFKGRNPSALMAKVLNGSYAELPTTYSEHFRGLIKQMLTNDANNRPTVEQLLLDPYFAATGVTVAAAPVEDSPLKWLEPVKKFGLCSFGESIRYKDLTKSSTELMGKKLRMDPVHMTAQEQDKIVTYVNEAPRSLAKDPHVWEWKRAIVDCSKGCIVLLSDHSTYKTLKQRIQAKHPLSTARLLYWTRQIIMGLFALGNAHMAHGRLTPSNIVIANEYGDLAVTHMAIPAATRFVQDHTAHLPYTPPEGPTISESADVWALGAIVYELACSSPLNNHRVGSADLPQLVVAQLTKHGYPSGLVELVQGMVEPDPVKRPSLTTLMESPLLGPPTIPFKRGMFTSLPEPAPSRPSTSRNRSVTPPTGAKAPTSPHTTPPPRRISPGSSPATTPRSNDSPVTDSVVGRKGYHRRTRGGAIDFDTAMAFQPTTFSPAKQVEGQTPPRSRATSSPSATPPAGTGIGINGPVGGFRTRTPPAPHVVAKPTTAIHLPNNGPIEFTMNKRAKERAERRQRRNTPSPPAHPAHVLSELPGHRGSGPPGTIPKVG